MAITQVFNDTFTAADGTLLTTHTPEQGLGWSPVIGNGGTNAQIQGGTLVQPFYNPSDSSYYTANTTESATLAQELEFNFSVAAGRTGRVCLRLRDGSTGADCILLEFSPALNNVRIFSVINGATTLVAESLNAAGLIVDGVLCKASVDAANTVTARIASTDITFNASTVVSGHDVAGKFGWRGVKSYTTNGIDNFKGFYDVGGATPITFSGTIPTQSFTNGEVVSVDLSGYFSGTETPFTFANSGTALTGSGLALSSAGLLSGTYTGTPITGVIVTGTDTATNTASSNAFNVDTAEAVVVTSAITFSMPQMTVSASASIITANPSITSEPLKDNTGALLANQALDYVAIYDNSTGALVLRVTSISTNASGVFTVSDAALTAGVTYKLDWKVTTQSAARMPAKAAV